MRFTRVFSTAALLIVACAALWGMRSTTPNYTRLLAPIESRGDAGSFVRGRSIAVRVDGMEIARKLQGTCIGETKIFDTGGVWLIVHATAMSVQRPETLMAVAVESPAGERYLKSDRPELCGDLLSSLTLQPDVPASGDLIFELPAAALAGADLLAASAPFGLAPLDSQLRIRLGLDAAAAAQRMAQIAAVYEIRKR
jgi:hypothetical protein